MLAQKLYTRPIRTIYQCSLLGDERCQTGVGDEGCMICLVPVPVSQSGAEIPFPCTRPTGIPSRTRMLVPCSMLPVAGPGIPAGIRLLSGSFSGGRCRPELLPRALRAGHGAPEESARPATAALE